MFLGEFPPLPPDVIRALHRRTMDVKVRLADAFWDSVADGAVMVFESWKKTK